MSNLLNMLDELLPEELVPSLAKVNHESESSIITALQNAIPSIFLGVMNSNSNIHDKLNNILKTAGGKVNLNEDLMNGILQGKNSDSWHLGSQLLDTLFDKKSNAISNIISNESGLRSSSSNAILIASGTLIASFLGKKLLGENLSIGNLIQWLSSHKHEIENSLPQGFLKLTSNEVPDQLNNQDEDLEENSSKKWMLPLILFGLIGIGLWYWMQGCNKESNIHNDISAEVLDSAGMSIDDASDIAATQIDTTAISQIDTTLGKIDENGNWLEKKGDSIRIKLDNGVEIKAYKNSLEDKLYSFIKDPTAIAGKDVWFNFNDLLFNTGKSTLKNSSSIQIDNIVEITNAFPDLKIKLGGYTDNIGDSTKNVKLSENRAKTVYNLLLNKGVSKASFDEKPYEGYGPLHPVADNTTTAGRAQNRRISLSVRAK